MESSIGPYSILRLINGGGQGRVYLGYDRRLHRQVAIKIHRLPASRSARRRALEEARRVAGIQSPRVVQIYDVVQSSDYLAMVMEYVPGCDLEDFLSAAQPSLASVVTVASDLAAALASSRQQGLVHGDIKAANVLVTPQGRVKLTDFGIARTAGAGHTPAGSPSAMAPEQLAGQAADIRTDLFSLGRLLYRMLTGEHSFSREGEPDPQLLAREHETVSRALSGDTEIPPQLLSMVDQLLQPDPEQRPANTHHVRRLLRGVSRQLPLSCADSLLREARPFFRPESPADIPPQIPDQLQKQGRSSGTLVGLRYWRWPLLPLSPVVTLAGLVLLVVAIPLVAAWRGQVTRIQVEPPLVEVIAGASPALSAQAMVEAVRDAVAQVNPAARFSGAVNETAIHAADRGAEPDEKIALKLRCDELACLLLLQRRLTDETVFQQVLLARQQPEAYWFEQLRQATAALYNQ